MFLEVSKRNPYAVECVGQNCFELDQFVFGYLERFRTESQMIPRNTGLAQGSSMHFDIDMKYPAGSRTHLVLCMSLIVLLVIVPLVLAYSCIESHDPEMIDPFNDRYAECA